MFPAILTDYYCYPRDNSPKQFILIQFFLTCSIIHWQNNSHAGSPCWEQLHIKTCHSSALCFYFGSCVWLRTWSGSGVQSWLLQLLILHQWWNLRVIVWTSFSPYGELWPFSTSWWLWIPCFHVFRPDSSGSALVFCFIFATLVLCFLMLLVIQDSVLCSDFLAIFFLYFV